MLLYVTVRCQRNTYSSDIQDLVIFDASVCSVYIGLKPETRFEKVETRLYYVCSYYIKPLFKSTRQVLTGRARIRKRKNESESDLRF